MPVRYLCLDTSAGATCALWDCEEGVLARGELGSPRAHAEQLSPLIARLIREAGWEGLGEAGITGVAVGTGPAPFTGLRAGLVTARTIAYTLGVDVWGICSLDALARQVLDVLDPSAKIAIVTDARRREVYAATYEAQGPTNVARLWGPEVMTASDLARRLPPHVQVFGAGAHLYRGELEALGEADLRLDAAHLGRLVHARRASGAKASEFPTEPLYLRRPDIHGQK